MIDNDKLNDAEIVFKDEMMAALKKAAENGGRTQVCLAVIGNLCGYIMRVSQYYEPDVSELRMINFLLQNVKIGSEYTIEQAEE